MCVRVRVRVRVCVCVCVCFNLHCPTSQRGTGEQRQEPANKDLLQKQRSLAEYTLKEFLKSRRHTLC